MNKNGDFSTLLKTYKGYGWHPSGIEELRSLFTFDYLQHKDFEYKIGKNLGYNLQYLEYLQKQIFELKLSAPLTKMIYKNYLITALSIIETIFAFLVKKSNLWKIQRWKKVKEGSVNFENVKPEIIDGKKYKVDTQRYVEIEPCEMQMDFIDLLQSVRDNHLISTISEKNWKFLQRFYKKRNRVHIRITENVSTEYNDFEEIDYLSAKFLLRNVIFDKNVMRDNELGKKYLDFLFFTDKEKEYIAKYQKR